MMKQKRPLSAILAACILAGCCLPAAGAAAEDSGVSEQQVLYGDVTADNVIDVSDAVAIARYYSQDWTLYLTDQGKKQGDVNLDGNMDDKDLKMVLEYIARRRTTLGVAEEQQAEQHYNAVKLTDSVEAGTADGKEADAEFISSQFKLTVDLFKGAAKDPQSNGKDVLISPLSISQALAMTANGADGDTKTEMEKILGDTLDMDALNQYYYDYTEKLSGNQNSALHLANSIWFKNNSGALEVPQEFLQTAKNYYHADAFAAPFDNSTVSDINSWVNYHTHEMIPSLLEQLDPSIIMILINALAFEAEWQSPYDEFGIHPEEFHAYDGDMTAELMFGEEYRYLEDENAAGFLKPYKGSEYSFAAILPKNSGSIFDYIDSMTPESLQKLLTNSTKELVHTKVPKFKHDYSVTLNDILKQIGMERSFSNEADFSGLNSKEPTKIDSVIHKTFIQVDERGTKAGAVTAVMMAPSSADYEPPKPKYVYLNRPFIYAIVDNSTNLPVFIGYVLHPTAAAEEES